jgi:phage head maturation protease
MRALATIAAKAIQERERRITGIATSPRIDRMGDIIEPLGITAAPDIPLLLHHNSEQVIGRAKLGAPTSRGVPFEASIPRVSEAGRLRDRIEEAWQSLAHGLLRDISAGFRSLEAKLLPNGGIHFQKVEILELSLVAIGANMDATVNAIKANKAERAALVQRLRAKRSTATFDRSAYARMVREAYASDPMLRELRDRRTRQPSSRYHAFWTMG